MNGHDKGWTAQQKAMGERMWAAGASSVAIAEALGVTKNAVCGYRNRLGWPPRTSAIRGDRARAAARAVATKAAKRDLRAPAADARRAYETPPGLSAAEIASQFRLRLAFVLLLIERERWQAPGAADAPPAAPAVVPVAPLAESVPASGESRTVFKPRRLGTCCWPIGEVGAPDFRFCEAVQAGGRIPYCVEHLARSRPKSSEIAADRKLAARAAAASLRPAAIGAGR